VQTFQTAAQIQREFFAFLPHLPTMSRAKQVITCKGISLHFLLFLNYRENNISYYSTYNEGNKQKKETAGNIEAC